MKKGWLVAGLSALTVMAVGVAVFSDHLKLPAALKQLVSGPSKDAKPDVSLQFVGSEVTSLQPRRLHRVVQFSGPLVAPNTAIVRSRSAGTLLSLSVAEGSRVRAAEVIGRVDASEIDARIAERRALLESARAQAAQAARTHAVNQRLADQQFISATALDNSRATVQTAEAQREAAQASLDSLRVAQRDTTLVAPIAGIVAKRFVLPGEKLSVEQQVLSIVSLRHLELAGSVGTHEVALLTPGMPVELAVEGVARAVQGTLVRIAPAADAGSRSIGVAVSVDNPDERLRAGQYAVAQVTLRDERPRLTLPVTAVFDVAGQPHVWLLADGVLQRRAVTTGQRDERQGLVEVLQGVTPDMQVLAVRFDNLREGAKAVRVAQRAPDAASMSAAAADAR